MDEHLIWGAKKRGEIGREGEKWASGGGKREERG